jgi:SanA protein
MLSGLIGVTVFVVILVFFVVDLLVGRFGSGRIIAHDDVGGVRKRMDWAIVLGGPVGPEGRLSSVLEDRLFVALELLHQGKVERILCSGSGSVENNEVGVMRTWLEGNGVPSCGIVVDPAGYRTFDSMHRARFCYSISSAYILSQRFHLPRALFLARMVGLDVVGLSTNRRVYLRSRWFRIREVAARLRAVIDVLLYVARRQ